MIHKHNTSGNTPAQRKSRVYTDNKNTDTNLDFTDNIRHHERVINTSTTESGAMENYYLVG